MIRLTSSSSISGSDGRKFSESLDIEYFHLDRAKNSLDGCSSGRDVFERSGGSFGRSESGGKFSYESVRS